MLFMRIIHRREISPRSAANPAGGLRADKAQLASPKNEAAALSAPADLKTDTSSSSAAASSAAGGGWGEDLDRARKTAVVVPCV